MGICARTRGRMQASASGLHARPTTDHRRTAQTVRSNPGKHAPLYTYISNPIYTHTHTHTHTHLDVLDNVTCRASAQEYTHTHTHTHVGSAVGVCNNGAPARGRGHEGAGGLEGQAEALAGTFNAQGESHTLWVSTLSLRGAQRKSPACSPSHRAAGYALGAPGTLTRSLCNIWAPPPSGDHPPLVQPLRILSRNSVSCTKPKMKTCLSGGLRDHKLISKQNTSN